MVTVWGIGSELAVITIIFLSQHGCIFLTCAVTTVSLRRRNDELKIFNQPRLTTVLLGVKKQHCVKAKILILTNLVSPTLPSVSLRMTEMSSDAEVVVVVVVVEAVSTPNRRR